MRVYTILTVVMTYMSLSKSQVLFGTNNNQQSDPTSTRLGLVSSQIGVAPVPGAQSEPGRGNSGGGIFTEPDNFNPPGVNGNNGCFCHPPNQRCPPGAVSRSKRSESDIGDRIANNPARECPGQRICCSGNVNSPVDQGPGPVGGPILQQNCGVRRLGLQNTNQAETVFGEFPWMAVILEQNNNYHGGGVFISANWVLTAAHSVNDFIQQPQSLKIRVGDHDVATPQEHATLRHEEVTVQQIILHPEFNSNNLKNDVALLRLSQPVNHQGLPHIEPVCLPEQGQLFASQRCWVSGWGEKAFSSGQLNPILKKVDIPVWDQFVCEQRLQTSPRLGESFTLHKSFLCAGGEQGKDACTGDGGAPLVCEGSDGRFAVVGLVAWGLGCGQTDIPGVYVNVANFVDFIQQTTQ